MTGPGAPSDPDQPPPAPKPGSPKNALGGTPPAPATPQTPPKQVNEPGEPKKPGPSAGAAAPKQPPGPQPPPAPKPKPASKNGGPPEKTVGEIFLEVSEQATILVREEIELAKTEVTEKVGSLLRGSVVALVAGVFLFLALFLAMHGIAIYLGDNVLGHRVWLGYLIESAVFVLIAAGGGYYAYLSFKKGPPVPEMAIEQAKEIRASLDSSG
jgi:hypothetical protein